MIPGFANLNYYEILDVSMGVNAKEVQEAYYLVRDAFSKASLSSYSLYTVEEREEIGKLIEEAYHILFDDQSRHEYDRNLADNRIRVEKSRRVVQTGLPFAESELQKALAAEAAARAEASAAEIPAPEPEPTVDESQGNLPFDLTPPDARPAAGTETDPTPAENPVEDEQAEPLLLTEEAHPHEPGSANGRGPEPEPANPAEPPPEQDSTETASAPAVEPNPPPAAVITQPGTAFNPDAPPSAETELATGPRRALLDHLRDGVTGPNLKRVREQRGFTLDQAFENTRIRRPILQSIEEEVFDQLPAAVFLRGMVANYARFLGLPDPETIAKNYVDRLTAATGG